MSLLTDNLSENLNLSDYRTAFIISFFALLWSYALAGQLANAADKNSGKTYYVNNAVPKNESGDGTKEFPFKWISDAAKVAGAGDTVLVSEGIYRETISPVIGGTKDRRLIYKTVSGDKVIVRGSEVWLPQRSLDGSDFVFEGALDFLELKKYNPFAVKYAAKSYKHSLGQVFVAGREFLEVTSVQEVRETPDSFFADWRNEKLYVHYSKQYDQIKDIPLTEVVIRKQLFAPAKRGLGYITVKGFVFEQAANQYPSRFWEKTGFKQMGALSTRSGHHWRIIDNTVRHANSIGVDIGSEGYYREQLTGIVGSHIVEGNTVSENGCCGIVGWKSPKTIIRNNIVERNNTRLSRDVESAGIKVHRLIEGEISDNLVRDNHAYGVWIDNGYSDTLVKENVVVGNKWGGLFVELGGGPISILDNIFAYTEDGSGIYTHDASGLYISGNIFFANSRFGVWSRTISDRSYLHEKTNARRLASSSNIKILGNVFVSNSIGNIKFPFSNMDNYSDDNTFVRMELNTQLGGNLFFEEGGLLDEELNLDEELSLQEWTSMTGMDKRSNTHTIGTNSPTHHNNDVFLERVFYFSSCEDSERHGDRFQELGNNQMLIDVLCNQQAFRSMKENTKLRP